MRRPSSAVALVLAAGLVLSACGSTTTVVTQGSQSSPTPPSTRTATGTTPRTPSATATGTVATTTNTNIRTQGSPPACVASMLKLAYLGGQGATGHGELGFSLTNASGQSCHTYGYPGVQFEDASGAPLATHLTRATHDFFGSAPASELIVAPGKTASFRLDVTHGQGTSAGCTTAAKLQAIPPDDTHTLVVTIPNGGAYECGTGTVSPLQPGNTAFQ